MTDHVLGGYRLTWQAKPVLREIYRDYYRRICAHTVPGRTLEIGAGSGNLKEYLGAVVSTDIVPSPWLDAAADAQALPFRERSFDNIVGVDILHHIESPARFFGEADRLLESGGRLVLLEPAITVVSGPFFRLFHPEPVDMGADPFAVVPPSKDRAPFDANQAIPTLLFQNRLADFNRTFPHLGLVHLDWLSLLAYPLSGGFRPWSLVPLFMVQPLIRLEDSLPDWIRRLLAFRLLIVLEKKGRDSESDHCNA